ncbi:hypothetical protein BDD12DRAFT_812592 [Trichophaea hybrida]|nr:hypothetical protein BDD12DRAFT_812592 [Trichophaea hybrida]
MFHTNLGDVVSIYVLNKHSNGGSFCIASLGNVYNFLHETRPGVLLLQFFFTDLFHANCDSKIASFLCRCLFQII